MRKIAWFVILTMLLGMFSTSVFAAQEQPKLEQCSIKTTQFTSFKYWLYTPQNPTDDMPLIVYLHGGSGKGNDLSLITAVDGFPKYLQDGQLGDLRAYVIIPQLPADQTGWTSASASIMQLINKVQQTYSIDPDNISLTGHSMGGTGVWSVALSYPATFARIAPLSGSIKKTTTNINKLKNIPVWAFVGGADTIVDPSSSEDMVAALQNVGGDAKIVNFESADHFSVPALVYLDREIGLLNWLIDSKFAVRDAQGSWVYTTNFEDAMGYGNYLQLLSDGEIDATLQNDLFVDLNGHNLSGTLITQEYCVYGMDCATDSYKADQAGSFFCKDSNGEVVSPAVYVKSDFDGTMKQYLAVKGDESYSFHRFYMGLTHINLKPSTDGLGYKAMFLGDSKVASMIEEIGYTVWLQDQPAVLKCKTAEGFISGDSWTIRIDGIDPQQYGQQMLYAKAHMVLLDGTVIESNSAGVTLKAAVEAANSKADLLSQSQIEAVADMIKRHAVMRNWNVDQLLE